MADPQQPQGTKPQTTSSTTQTTQTTQQTTAALQAAAAASTPQQQQRDAVLACLLQGLATIGINAQASTVIVFSAINSDQLCVTLAHSIEKCLAQKGYDIQALSAPFQQLRADGTQISVDALVTALVSISWPIQTGGGSQ